MKGASNIFPIIVAALLAIAILSFGFYLIKLTKMNAETLTKEKNEMLKNIENAYALEKNCRNWLNSGGEMYNAEKILKEYKIPELFKPFSEIYENICGKNLENIAYKCLSSSDETYCNGKYVKANEEIANCVQVCNKVISIYNNYCSSCANDEEKNICLATVLNYLGNNILLSDSLADIADTETIQKACKGELSR